MSDEMMRINKYLSSHGYCSRREADRLVEKGRVFVNGERATMGQQVGPDDQVRVEGRDKKKPPKKIYIALNKPVGVISTTDKKSHNNVVEFVGHKERIFPVGRLDVASSGLILLTNDGVLANRLMHPRFEHEKEYVVQVSPALTREDIRVLQHGVELDDGMTLPAKVRQLTPNKFAIILQEGRNRQIRRMCEARNLEVKSLHRTRVGTLKIPLSYPKGQWRNLTSSEVRELKELVGMDTRSAAQRNKKTRRR